jgi:ABC-2 type transport system ATP-binding protein
MLKRAKNLIARRQIRPSGSKAGTAPSHAGRRLFSPHVSAIEVFGLRKSYGPREVLHGVSFAVETGEVFALLGPNGAGKTTTVEILEGYRRRDGGEVRVLGTDPARGGRDFRSRIGIVLQSSAVYPLLTVRETLDLFAGYYPHPRKVGGVIELVGLAGKVNARVRTLSGGQLRRLDLALALIGDPDVIFLDEPTTGFDPAARRQAWETIRDLRALGKSILLTTHYMEEAQRLSDRIAILADGRIVTTGSPRELLAEQVVEIRFRRNGEDIVLTTTEPTRVLNELTSDALAEGVELEGLEVHPRTLEDVYLELTREEAEV